MSVSRDRLSVALVHEVFYGADRLERLEHCLARARSRGAELAILPEFPLDRWIPATRTTDDADAEPPEGPREQLLAQAARAASIAVLAGAIVIDAQSLQRRNRALLFDAGGQKLTHYDKLHIPNEPGFWEAEHYVAGDTPPQPVEVMGFPLGIQICSDLQRLQGAQLLSAAGALAIMAPRATPPESYERWRTVIRALAISCAVYVVSVNRPRPEGELTLGGPSLAVDPAGRVMIESVEPVTVVELSRAQVDEARKEYPGYLEVRAELYARAWSNLQPSSGQP